VLGGGTVRGNGWHVDRGEWEGWGGEGVVKEKGGAGGDEGEGTDGRRGG